jgi:hypothetical protein
MQVGGVRICWQSCLQVDGLANVDSPFFCARDLIDVYELVNFHIMYSGTKEELHKSLELRKEKVFDS